MAEDELDMPSVLMAVGILMLAGTVTDLLDALIAMSERSIDIDVAFGDIVTHVERWGELP